VNKVTSAPIEDLARFFDVERRSEREHAVTLQSYFGEGQTFDLLGRAALAVQEASDALELASLRAVFLRPLPHGVPLRLTVEDVGAPFEGRAVRRVQVRGELLLAEVTALFTSPEPAPDYAPLMPEKLVEPEQIPTTHETARREGWEQYAAGPIEFRRLNPVWPPPPEERLLPHREWLRPRVPLPSDPRLHTAALALASHFYNHWEFQWRIDPGFAYERFAILEHAVWLHRAARWDDWWLLDAESDLARHGRARSRRRIFARDGRLLASATTHARVGTH